MNQLLLKSLGALVLGASMVVAADPPELVHPSDKAGEKVALFTDPHWKKVTLSREFLSEGATFGDFNHDGVQDAWLQAVLTSMRDLTTSNGA